MGVGYDVNEQTEVQAIIHQILELQKSKLAPAEGPCFYKVKNTVSQNEGILGHFVNYEMCTFILQILMPVLHINVLV